MADATREEAGLSVATPSEEDRTAWYHLLFGVRRSVRYHNRRRRFFDNLNRWKTALALLSGSAAMVTILAKMDPALPLAASAFVTVVSTLDLVLGTTTKARLHADLARRFLDLERKMTLLQEPSVEDLRTSTADRLLIEADEPPIMRVVDILCHNELLLAMGHDPRECCAVPWYKRLLAPVISMSAEGLQTVGEQEARRNN